MNTIQWTLISLMSTQIIVLFLLIKYYRLARKINEADTIIDLLIKNDIRREKKEILNNIIKHDEKHTNDKNKHENTSRATQVHKGRSKKEK